MNKGNRLRYGLAFSAIIIGFIIIRVSINDAGTIRENIVSCIPEELSEMFDQEQSIICSNLQFQKSVLVGGISLGVGLAITGFIIAFVDIIKALMRNNVDKTSLKV